MLDITKLMNDLAGDRPVFHSEADFQLAFGLCVHNASPNERVRLEYRPFPTERMYVDIWLPAIQVAVELKYQTRRLAILYEGEAFELLNQGARDIRRYDFLKDVQRLERLLKSKRAKTGFVVLLTNDHSLWTQPSSSGTIDAAFQLHEGRTVTGRMAWSEKASPGGIGPRKEPILLEGSYDLHWQDYWRRTDGHNSWFRYLVVKVSG